MQTSALSWFLMFGEFEIWVLGWVDEASKSKSYWAVAAETLIRMGRLCSFPPPHSDVTFYTNLSSGLLVFIIRYIWRWILDTCGLFKAFTKHFIEIQRLWGQDWEKVGMTCKTSCRLGSSTAARAFTYPKMLLRINWRSVMWVNLIGIRMSEMCQT